MKINARLKKIGDLVEANSFCLDVGCDHALLDIYLVKQNKDIKAVASDIAEGPLTQAKNNIKREKLDGKIETRLGYGLRTYTNDINTGDDELNDLLKLERQELPATYLKASMKNFTYDSSDHKLRSPKETARMKTGNCHDQVLYELDQLKKGGHDAKAKFLIEVDSKTGQGGQTHSYVYYKDGKEFVWFENVWEDQKGEHRYNSEKELHDDVKKKFRANTSMDKIYDGDFKAKPGDTLQDIVNKSLK